jgi:soluble lytic murein transglycosylase-like protein
MMIGGMAAERDAVPAAPSVHAESPDVIASADDAGPRSVVFERSRSSLMQTPQSGSESVAARVLALSPLIEEAARIADVDSALLMAVIDVESGGDPRAVSPKGATGLMQLMPGTGERHGATNLYDPRQNISAGARYLGALMRQFGEMSLALAAYNAGEGAVQKYGDQIPPYAETMSYVPKVIARYRWYREAVSSAGGAVTEPTRTRYVPVSADSRS